MKKLLLLFVLAAIIANVYPQVAISTDGSFPNASAMLDIESTEKGLLIPRMIMAERDAVDLPAEGLLIYQTDNTPGFYYYEGSSWEIISSGAMEINNLIDGKTDASSVFLGSGAGGNDNGTFNTNIAIGIDALKTNTSGAWNTAIGYQALFNNTENRNTAIGYRALYCNRTGNYNLAIGHRANYFNYYGSNNTAIGYEAGMGTTSHSKTGNIFLGYQAGYNEMGDNKLYIQNSNSSSPLIYGEFDNGLLRVNGTLDINNAYQFPTADGNSGQVLQTDGSGALSWNDDGGATEINDLTDGKTVGGSVFLGSGAGANDDGTNNCNTAVGTDALNSNTTGFGNSATGERALASNMGGGSNTASGYSSLYNNTEGDLNTAIGYCALYGNITGNYNTAIGHEANQYNMDGSNNTAIGYKAGHGTSSHSKTGNIFLGFKAGYNETGDNKLYIENSNSSSPLIGGDFDADEIYLNGNVGIGTTDPNEILEVANKDNGHGRMIVSDAGGSNRYVLLFESPSSSDEAARIESYKYGSGAGGKTLEINTVGDAITIFGGNVVPEAHKNEDLGEDGRAWDNVYHDDLVNQGSASFADRNVTDEIILFPPRSKKPGDFDYKNERGLEELDPSSLPRALKEDNGILIDEMTTYNYKANYDQQLMINQLIKEIELLKKGIAELKRK